MVIRLGSIDWGTSATPKLSCCHDSCPGNHWLLEYLDHCAQHHGILHITQPHVFGCVANIFLWAGAMVHPKPGILCMLTPFLREQSKQPLPILPISTEIYSSWYAASIPSFWSALCADHGIIFASSALNIILRQSDVAWQPTILNVAVPAKCGRFLSELLTRKVFRLSTELKQNGWEPKHTWTRTWELCKAPHRVVVMESQDQSVLPIMLGMRSTLHMVAISPRRIYCFYPDLTLNEVDIKGPPAAFENNSPFPSVEGVMLSPCLEMTTLADHTCPVLFRQIHGRQNIGVMV